MNNFHETDLLTHVQLTSSTNELLTDKQWLKRNRYPLPSERGIKIPKRKGLYFTYEQTKKVRSEAEVNAFPGFLPIKELKKGKHYYFYDECESKYTPDQWIKLGRKVRKNSVACEIRDGFNHKTKEKLYISFFIKSDTYKINN